jgi:MFS family permease
MGETLRVLFTKRTFWLIAFAAAVKAFIGYGHAPFTASFFLRVHTEEVAGLARFFGVALGYNLQSVGFLGLALGIMGGLAGAAGSLLGGWIADKFGKNDLRAYMVTPAIASLITIPVYILAVSVESAALAICILVINGLLGTLWYGPVYSTAQGIVPTNMRATASAVLLFVINLIGLGLGPLLVGMLSDYFANGMGMGAAQGVRWALMVSTMFGIAAFAMFWMARRTIREEMES